MKQRIQKSNFLFLALLANTCLINAEKIVISDYKEFQKLKDDKRTGVVKISAEWCGACKMVKDAFDEVANDPKYDHIAFVYVDADKNGETLHREGVTGLPTFLYLIDGEVKDKEVGVKNPDTFADDLRNKVASAKPLQGSVQAAVDTKSEVKTEEATVNPEGMAATVKDEAKEVAQDMKDQAKKGATATEEEAGGLFDKLKAFIVGLFASLKDLLMSIVNWVKGLFGK